MAMFACREEDYELWDYINGDIYTKQNHFEGIYKKGKIGCSITAMRYDYFNTLFNQENNIKIVLRDEVTNNWTKEKWRIFPGLLIRNNLSEYGYIQSSYLTTPIDVHRSMLNNEVVIESDYPTYEENWEASKIIGRILEEKGFNPIYYYSGNKSIHIHVFLDWSFMRCIDPVILDQLKILFNGSKLRFKKTFIMWLRKKMISCWDTNIKKFDTDLIKSSHLIRAELSKNKKGFKTFLGYTYKDMSFVPYICNEENKLYPRLGDIKLSIPNDPYTLIDEFIGSLIKKTKLDKLKEKNYSLGGWMNINEKKELRKCVKLILSENFSNYNDGFNRGMFILVNELKRTVGEAKAREIIYDWNKKMNFPIKDAELEYRLKNKEYSLSCKYIHGFLKDMNIETPIKCN